MSWKLSLVKITVFQKLRTKIFFKEKHLASHNGTYKAVSFTNHFQGSDYFPPQATTNHRATIPKDCALPTGTCFMWQFACGLSLTIFPSLRRHHMTLVPKHLARTQETMSGGSSHIVKVFLVPSNLWRLAAPSSISVSGFQNPLLALYGKNIKRWLSCSK